MSQTDDYAVFDAAAAATFTGLALSKTEQSLAAVVAQQPPNYQQVSRLPRGRRVCRSAVAQMGV
jgi:hypothetical protein